MPPQIYSAFIRCNTLYLAMQGVCHPFPLDSLKGCVGAEAIQPNCLCILATLRLISAQAHPQLVPYLPYRSRQHSHLWLECFPPQRTSVSVATASATSFLSSAVMYLWGQFSHIRRYCPGGHFVHVEQTLPHYSLLTFFAKIATDFDEFTKCLYFLWWSV